MCVCQRGIFPFWQRKVSCIFLVQMCPLFSHCVCVHSRRPIERGDDFIVTASPLASTPGVTLRNIMVTRPRLCFRSPEQLTARQGHSGPGVAFFCCEAQANGGAVEEKSVWTGAQGRGWEMTDGRMEWCQAGQNDSWNRLSIYDCPRKTSLSDGCHIILVIK